MTRAGWLRSVVIGAAIAILEVACRAKWIDPVALISPSRMVAGAWKTLASSEYRGDMAWTLQSVVMAFALALAGGFGLGWLLHRLPRLRRAAVPLLASYYAVPVFMF